MSAWSKESHEDTKPSFEPRPRPPSLTHDHHPMPSAPHQRSLTVVSGATEDEQLVVRRREAEQEAGRRTWASGDEREVRPRVG